MGVGKSTLGAALADATGRGYVDSDDDIEQLFGVTGATVAAELGVDELHRIEAAVLLGALARAEPLVITAAASVVEDAVVRTVLNRRAVCVHLTAEVDELLRRQAASSHRRPIDRAELVSLATRRAAMFRSIADIEVAADRDPAVLVDDVLNRLSNRSISGDVPHA